VLFGIYVVAAGLLVGVGAGFWWWWRNGKPPVGVVLSRGIRFLGERGVRIEGLLDNADAAARTGEAGGEGEALVDLESGHATGPTARVDNPTTRTGEPELVDVSIPEMALPKPTPMPTPCSAPAPAPAPGYGSEGDNSMPLVDVSSRSSPPSANTAAASPGALA
jgi:hypothetical protein